MGIDRKYAKNKDSVQQTLSLIVDASTEKVFYYLSTTEGISSWFKELSFESKNALSFDMGDGKKESLPVYRLKKNEELSFDWFTGTVTFHLTEYDGKTKITFHESVPLHFQHISRDFSGWDTHMTNIKNIVETGAAEEMDIDAFNKRQHAIDTILAP